MKKYNIYVDERLIGSITLSRGECAYLIETLKDLTHKNWVAKE